MRRAESLAYRDQVCKIRGKQVAELRVFRAPCFCRCAYIVLMGLKKKREKKIRGVDLYPVKEERG